MATTNPPYGKQTPYHLKLATAVNQLIALWTGNCLKSAVIYQATIATEDNRPAETYVGLTENSFKTRYSNHKSSFRDPQKRLGTEPETHKGLKRVTRVQCL